MDWIGPLFAGDFRAGEVAVFWVEDLQELEQVELLSGSVQGQLGFQRYLLDFHFCCVGSSGFYAGSCV